MRGTHRVIVQNKRMRYDFAVRRNLTIIRGDSATGKTTLIEMIREYYENGISSGVQLYCDKECTILSGRSWRTELALMEECIVFIDEGNEFVLSDEFASAAQKTGNYYVIVTREGVPSLPYSVEEIYGIRNAGKYGTLKQTYNEFYQLYGLEENQKAINPTVVVTEDSNSGYQFFKAICDKNQIACICAGGKSNIFATMVNQDADKRQGTILIIADGAAFGAEMEKIMHFMKTHERIALYLPESFEWLILKSGIIEDGEISEILAAPGNYVDSREYFSWERFFTAVLVRKADHTYLKYTKKTLNTAYLTEKLRSKILKTIQQVIFEKETDRQ